MANPKLISPLLDGFIMGEPFSNHHGVQSCPALREETEERYIVKVVSIPATQNQLDALLLSGAFTDEESAQKYFRELSEDVCKEASILSQLSKLEGFLPYQASQTIKNENGVGYQVYLLSPYRQSLEKQMRTEALTHLAAVNLGLDMCAALSVCRKAGYLYADLKPENIYLSDMRGFCIGDLGFISLSSLKYASLPEKYRSQYTPPEISDAYAAINTSLDTYALGLVLYQIFNNGILPADNNPMPVPMYADYEMAAIIMKACAPKPEDRWESPEQMGQALVDYMQRNEVNDVSIIPAPVIEEAPAEDVPEEFLSEEENDQELAELLAMIPDEEPPISEEIPDDTPDDTPDEDASGEENSQDAPEENCGEAAPVSDADTDLDSQEETNEDELYENTVVPDSADEETDEDSDEVIEEHADNTEPAAEDDSQQSPYARTELTEEGVTTEVAEMLAQADELLQMELPEPVVAPDAIEIPIPPPIVSEPDPIMEEPVEDEDPEDSVDSENPEDSPEEEIPAPSPAESTDNIEEPEEQPIQQPVKKRRTGGIIATIVIVLALIAAGVFARHYYKNIYLQTVDRIEIIGSRNEISVLVESKVADELLFVVCTDTYGNTFRSPLSDGQAHFKDLKPGTRYTVQVQISGTHKLLGMTSGSYTTVSQTEIRNFIVTPGSEDGSVSLSFTVNGPDSKGWQVQYSAPGIEPKVTYFTGTHINLSELTIDAEYTFVLTPTEDLFLAEGSNIATFTPRKTVYATDIAVNSYRDGVLELTWSLPEGTTAEKWNIRCFNDVGFDQVFTSETTSVTITDLDPSVSYTLRITADGMARSEDIEVSANPINITGYTCEQINPWSIKLSWQFDGQAPASGWTLTYTLNGDTTISLLCPAAEAIIPLTEGSTYDFEVCPVDDLTHFTTTYSYGPVSFPTYEGHGVTTEDMTLTLFQTPETEVWNVNDILNQGPSSTIPAGSCATVLLQLGKNYHVTDLSMTTTFVIIDSNNTLISTETSTRTWDEMWHNRKCIATLPATPVTPGSYVLSLYLDNCYLGSLNLQIL